MQNAILASIDKQFYPYLDPQDISKLHITLGMLSLDSGKHFKIFYLFNQEEKKNKAIQLFKEIENDVKALLPFTITFSN